MLPNLIDKTHLNQEILQINNNSDNLYYNILFIILFILFILVILIFNKDNSKKKINQTIIKN